MNPISRIGNVSSWNNATNWTSVPSEMAPVEIRQLPTAMSTTIPIPGRASKAGSNRARR